MSQDQLIHHDKVGIILRESLLKVYHDTVGHDLKDIDCSYFSHQLIKNFKKPGCEISAFCTNPDWHLTFWNGNWENDPLVNTYKKIGNAKESLVMIWNIVDPDSDAMEKRKAICKVSMGFTFCTEHENGLVENYSFGWDKFDADYQSSNRLLVLSNLVKEFRANHLTLSGQQK